MLNHQGISTGKEVRSLSEQIENEMLLNYRSYFVERNDIPLDQLDSMDWKSKKFSLIGEFREKNKSIIKRHAKDIEKAIAKDLEASYLHGIGLVENHLEKAKKKGFKSNPTSKLKEYGKNIRVKEQVDVLKGKLNMAYNNMIKHMDTQFITAIRTVDTVKANTLFQALNSVNQSLSKTGIVATVTANNRQINMSNYIELNTVEFSQEMLFMGEGAKNEEIGIYTVYVSKHSSSCPLCKPWEGKVLIDDVYQDGKPDGKHELLSVAIKAGLSHYNCRHNWVPYIEGLDVIPETESGIRMPREYEAEQKLRYNERMIREWKRREALAMTGPELEKAKAKVKVYQARNRDLVKSTDGLYRNYWREKPGFTVPKDVRWQGLKYDKKIFDN